MISGLRHHSFTVKSLGSKNLMTAKNNAFQNLHWTHFWQRQCWIQPTSWQNCWTPIKYSFKSLLRRSSSSTTLAYFCWKCTVRGFACDFYKIKDILLVSKCKTQSIRNCIWKKVPFISLQKSLFFTPVKHSLGHSIKNYQSCLLSLLQFIFLK